MRDIMKSSEVAMSAGATPKQGDHVFNDVAATILHPFETIRSLRSPDVEGSQFLHSYLLHTYSLVKQAVENHDLDTARQLVATVGAEQDALKEVSRLRNQYPALAQVTGDRLRKIHSSNSSQFGAAAQRYEVEFLKAIRESLEVAVAPNQARTRHPRTASPGIAYQQLIDAAYDPAAALIVVTSNMARESTQVQRTFDAVIVALADTLDKPAQWEDPFTSFAENRPTNTGKIIVLIRNVRLHLKYMNTPGFSLERWIAAEIAKTAQLALPRMAAECGAMLHLLHQQLQRMR
jgi:hypothetical protein